MRVCENCGERYAEQRSDQRWCSEECRVEYRNAELKAARKLFARANNQKELMQKVKSEHAA
jgi:hypothetical protein